jgi:hypothetical protein
MSIADKVRPAYGIEQFLRKHNYTWKRKELNNLFLEFAETSEYKDGLSLECILVYPLM